MSRQLKNPRRVYFPDIILGKFTRIQCVQLCDSVIACATAAAAAATPELPANVNLEGIDWNQVSAHVRNKAQAADKELWTPK